MNNLDNDVSGIQIKEVTVKTLDERCNENLLNLKILSEVNKNEKISVNDDNIEIAENRKTKIIYANENEVAEHNNYFKE